MIEDLVIRAKDSEPEAFSELYELFVEKIYRFLLFKVGSVTEAEDLTAWVFEKAWENLKKYKKGNFQAWLFKIARNTLIDFWRKEKKEKSLEEIGEIGSHTDILADLCKKDEQKQLLLAFKKLKNKYYEVLSLRFLNDLSVTETAKIINKSEGAVGVIQHRALKSLRMIMEEKNIELKEFMII